VLRGGDDLLAAARRTGVPVVRFTPGRQVTPLALVRLARELFCRPPHLLYTLTVVPNIWGRVLGRLAGVPAIVSGYRSLLPRQHEKRLWPLSRRIICNAAVLKAIMVRRCGVPPRKIAVIPNAVDTDFFSPSREPKPEAPTLLFVGRLVREKDPLTLLRGFARVQKAVPDSRLVMVGQGPLKARVVAHIRTASLGGSVTLLPPGEDVRPFLERAWLLVLPSISEAAPNVVLEAMAAGLPVVATRVGGTGELVEDGCTGRLVPPADDLRLAAAVMDLIRDEDLRRRMGREGRRRMVRHHSIQEITRCTERVLAAAVGTRAGK